MGRTIDVPNPLFTLGEYIQDLRDRDIKFLGLSAVAGFIEDLSKPDFPAFERARWSAISDEHIVPLDDNPWQITGPDIDAGLTRRDKPKAIIIGVSRLALWKCRQKIGNVRAWPAVAYNYRGVNRTGLLPNGFGQLDEYDAVGMMKGRNEFKTTLGLAWIKDDGFTRAVNGKVRRSDIASATLYIPAGVRTLDEVPADEMPDNVPLI